MRRKFSTEFKLEAVELVNKTPGSSVNKIAKDLGIGESTLSKWLKSYNTVAESSELSVDEREELRKLRQENHKLKLERELLKKATIFFASQNQS